MGIVITAHVINPACAPTCLRGHALPSPRSPWLPCTHQSATPGLKANTVPELIASRRTRAISPTRRRAPAPRSVLRRRAPQVAGRHRHRSGACLTRAPAYPDVIWDAWRCRSIRCPRRCRSIKAGKVKLLAAGTRASVAGSSDRRRDAPRVQRPEQHLGFESSPARHRARSCARRAPTSTARSAARPRRADGAAGHGTVGQHARAVRRLHPRRDQEVGEGGEVVQGAKLD